MIVIHHRLCIRIAILIGILSLIAPLLAQDNTTQERTFHASKAVVEKALNDYRASSGAKLPTLEGFVNSAGEPVDRYQRGYYQYSLTIVSKNPAETTVRVSAKITAWYKGDSPADSGYRVLPSNGRLESDLLDNVEDALETSHASAAPPVSSTLPPAPNANLAPVPDSPSRVQSTSSAFEIAQAATAVPATSKSQTAAEDSVNEQRVQQLTKEGDNLREILRNQSRPSNLVVVKTAKTPLLERPIEGSKVVLLASAQDEFQIVDTTGEWVHVQVSGISRGWVRRDQVDLPSAANGSLSTLENDPRTFDRAPAFQQTREEVSIFPGKWEPLDGKKVKIIWVQPSDKKSFGSEPKLNLVKSVFRRNFTDASSATPPVAGVVVILDSEDGGMAAATMAALQQWHAGHLPDGAFWKRCLLDPAEAFKTE